MTLQTQTALQIQIPHKCHCSCRTCSDTIEGVIGDTTANALEDITPDADTTANTIADGDTIIDIIADADAIVGAIPEVNSNADTITDSV